MAVEKEKHCNCCDESWPADSQFWFREARNPDKLSHICKACYYENVRPVGSRSTKPEVPAGRLTDALANILTPLPAAAIAL